MNLIGQIPGEIEFTLYSRSFAHRRFKYVLDFEADHYVLKPRRYVQ